MITEGCYCCEVRDRFAVRYGDLHPDVTQPPAYVWTTPGGDDVPLCIDCCAEWREYCYNKTPSVLDLISVTQLRVIR